MFAISSKEIFKNTVQEKTVVSVCEITNCTVGAYTDCLQCCSAEEFDENLENEQIISRHFQLVGQLFVYENQLNISKTKIGFDKTCKIKCVSEFVRLFL